MTPERRKSVLTAEVGKRVREYSGVKKDDVDGVVRALVGLDLGVVDALRDRVLLGEKVSEALTLVKAEAASVHPTPPASNLASPTPPSGASHPGPPTTPLADRSERERLLHAISKIESDPTKAKEVTEMILSLSRKERALCLFNNEVLKLKVSEAKAVIDSLEDDDEDTEGGPSALYPSPGKIKAPFATPQRTRSAPIDPTSPLSPEASVAQGAAVPASTPTSPAVSGTAALPKTVEGNGASVALKPIEEVAAWSTKDILTYVRENEAAINSGGLEGVPKPEEGKRREMDVFLDRCGLRARHLFWSQAPMTDPHPSFLLRFAPTQSRWQARRHAEANARRASFQAYENVEPPADHPSGTSPCMLPQPLRASSPLPRSHTSDLFRSCSASV